LSSEWNECIDFLIEYMKDYSIKNLSRHKVMCSSYIIDKIESDLVIRLIKKFREFKR